MVREGLPSNALLLFSTRQVLAQVTRLNISYMTMFRLLERSLKALCQHPCMYTCIVHNFQVCCTVSWTCFNVVWSCLALLYKWLWFCDNIINLVVFLLLFTFCALFLIC